MMDDLSQSQNDSCEILARFLRAFDTQSEAHARDELTADQVRLIERLARREATPEERDSLVPLLASNDNALELLAQMVKRRLQDPGGAA